MKLYSLSVLYKGEHKVVLLKAAYDVSSFSFFQRSRWVGPGGEARGVGAGPGGRGWPRGAGERRGGLGRPGVGLRGAGEGFALPPWSAALAPCSVCGADLRGTLVLWPEEG